MANNLTNNHEQGVIINQKEEEIKELETRIREQDSRLSSLQSNGFQLANFYFVFQGVILTAIVNGSSFLRCSDIWFLLSLSVLAAMLNLVSLQMIGRNYLRSYAQRDQTWVECHNLQADVASRKSSHHNSSSQEPVDEHGRERQSSIVHVDTWEQNKRKLYLLVCMVLFGCVATIMIVGCCTILCRKDDQRKHPMSNNEKCIRLCEGAKCVNICNDY